MKNKLSKELVLQISIILGCLVIVMLQFPNTPSHAQIACDDEPPLFDPDYPTKEAWAKGTVEAPRQISVVVFDPPTQAEPQNQTDFQIINEGIRSWNAYSVENCSNVVFKEATRAGRPYVEGEFILDDTIFVIRPSNSQMDPLYRNIGTQLQTLRAARIRIQYPFTSNTPGAFKKLVAHETGHSFGLRNETFPGVTGRTIMGTAFDITDCDTEAIKKVYCPAPTPTPPPPQFPEYCEPPYDPESNRHCL